MPGDLKPIKLESRDLNSRDEDEQQAEYYLCLSIPFEECDKSCESQCRTKNSFDKVPIMTQAITISYGKIQHYLS